MTTAREAVRHIIYKAGAYNIVTWMRARRGWTSIHFDGMDSKARFGLIYDAGLWRQGNALGSPGSGAGSSLAATVALRQDLPSLLNNLNAKILLDIGCGDFVWMQYVALKQIYIGFDIVDTIIKTNTKLFECSGRTFILGDATVDELPGADVVLCREVLFHLSFADIRKLLKNMLSKNRSYFMATTDRQTAFNSDIPTGDFRPLNLEAWPFRFPPPDRSINDSAVSPRRMIGVWEAKRIRPIVR
jgi:Methyltransferase domain